MAGKIFISYRREDSAASALGIGQYLENEFGKRNVFIDVDMHAGVKFPSVLEERLASCKVMLVLMGRRWASAKDEDGNRRLDTPNDWVRLEIARALQRGITVIPVRIDGAQLPKRSSLPPDVQGLLDHQATSVSSDGFRHEMAGLARDIRAIPSQTRSALKHFVWVALLVVLLGVGLLCWHYREDIVASLGILNKTENYPVSSFGSEWILFNITNENHPQYFSKESIKAFQDKISVNIRSILNPAKPVANNQTIPDASFEDDIIVFECNSDRWAFAKQTVFDKNAVTLYTYKWGDPEFLDLAIGGTLVAGSNYDTLKKLTCNEDSRRPYVTPSELSDMRLISLQTTADGKGQVFFKPIAKKEGIATALVVTRYNEDQHPSLPNVKDTLPPFRYNVARIDFSCAQPTVTATKVEDYNSRFELASAVWMTSPSSPITDNTSPLANLRRILCSPQPVEKCDADLTPAAETPLNGVYLGIVEEGTETTNVQLKLAKTDTGISGAYFRENVCGTVHGIVDSDGKSMRFEWVWGKGSGHGHAVQDGDTLTATAGYGNDEEGGGNLTLFRMAQ